MTWQQTFDQVAAHYARLAQTPGWWAYAQQQVIAMEAQEHGCWIGLRAAVGQRIKAAGFKPDARELASLSREPAPLPRLRRWHGE